MTPADRAAAVLRAVEVMDRLRAECPWDRQQTHASLARYLLEETYETLEAIETDDPALLREELGDLLFQVLFHARLAQESATPFDLGDVANDAADKLIRRHPHVFADTRADDAAAVEANWEQIKAVEKNRASVTDGIPQHQPALALAAKLVGRAARAGLPPPATEGGDVGARLMAVVRDAVAAGVDPEIELLRAARTYREQVRAAETADSAP